jgi:hypothetical protein
MVNRFLGLVNRQFCRNIGFSAKTEYLVINLVILVLFIVIYIICEDKPVAQVQFRHLVVNFGFIS